MRSDMQPAANALCVALVSYDDARARELLGELIEWCGVDVVAGRVVPLLLGALNRRLRFNQVCRAQRDFARGTLADCLLSLARGWAHGDGPRAILASTSGLRREIPLIGFGLALRRQGWRISYLGCDAPMAVLLDAVRALGPRLIVLGCPPGAASHRLYPKLRTLAAEAPLALFGASPSVAVSLCAMRIGDDVVAEARRISAAALASLV